MRMSKFGSGSIFVIVLLCLGISLTAQAGWQEIILQISKIEEGNGPNDVGRRLNRYPYKLERYLKKGRGWCSEFASWAYKVAGVPLNGGSYGGWMLTSSMPIKNWFLSNGQFISNDGSRKWYTFMPKAGDYIRFNNNRDGHSGIIIGTSGSTLYTIEGNFSNKVKKRKLKNWRKASIIDGIGIR